MILLSSSTVAVWGQAQTILTADQVIQRAISRVEETHANSAGKDFIYSKVTVTEELDAVGNVKDRKEKVYRVYFKNGETYAKLVSRDGHPVDRGDSGAPNESEASARQLLGDAKLVKSEKSFLKSEVVSRFNFKLLGQAQINDRPAYQITFVPKTPEPPVHGILERVMDRVSGTVWIDAQEFEIARVDIRLGSEVNLLGGMAGSLKKLAYTLNRTRVAEGIWFNTSSSGDFEGRKMIDSMRVKTRSQATGFRPLG